MQDNQFVLTWHDGKEKPKQPSVALVKIRVHENYLFDSCYDMIDVFHFEPYEWMTVGIYDKDGDWLVKDLYKDSMLEGVPYLLTEESEIIAWAELPVTMDDPFDTCEHIKGEEAWKLAAQHNVKRTEGPSLRTVVIG